MSKRCGRRRKWMKKEDIYAGKEMCSNCTKEEEKIYPTKKRRFIIL